MDLTIEGIIRGGIEKGLKYLGPLLVNALLWGLTCWIPYLNVGTTIALFCGGITAKISRDEEVSFTEIFNPVYRKKMGETFLALGLVNAAVSIGFIFFFAPGFIISIAFSLAVILVVDKGLSPMEAISKSNEVTYGKKFTMFISQFIIIVVVVVATLLVTLLFNLIPVVGPILSALINLAAMIFLTVTITGTNAVIYKALAS